MVVLNSSDGIKESISLIICFKIREDSIVKCSKLLDDLLKFCFTKTISETKNAANNLSRHEKYNEKLARRNRKCTELIFTLLKYPQSFKFSSSICTNQAPAFQQTCPYLRRNSATVSMLSVTGLPL